MDRDEQDDDDNIDVVIVDDDGNPTDYTPNEDVEPVIAGIDKNTDTEQTDLTSSVEDPLLVLQRNFDALKNEHTADKQKLQHLESQVDRVATTEREAQKALLAGGLAAAKTQLIAAKTAYASAMRDQKFEDVANAQEQITHAAADIRDYGAAIEELEATPLPKPKPKPTPEQMPHDQAVSQVMNSLTPTTRTFAEKYKVQLFPSDGNTDPFRQVVALDQLARARNIKPDTDAYFAFIESQMGWKEPEVKSKPTPGAAVRKPAPKQTAAPVTRAAGGNGERKRQELSKAEVDMARRLKMTPARYAKNKMTALERAEDPDYSGPKYSHQNPAIRGGR